MDPKIAWDNVEKAALALEDCRDHRELRLLEETLHAAIHLFFSELDPAQMIAQIESSALPTRAAVSWLVFEASRLSFLDQTQVQALADHWHVVRGPEDKLIKPPVEYGKSNPAK